MLRSRRQWLSRLFFEVSKVRAKRQHQARRFPRRLVLETLEERLVPSVTVTNPLDTTIGNEISLRQAITMVNNGQVSDNTVILPAGTYVNLSGALGISHSLNLEGAGPISTIISGGGTDRVFVVFTGNTVDLQISGVTIRDGVTTGSGGGIAVVDSSASSLSLTNSIVTGNTADSSAGSTSEYGGGIDVTSGSVTLTNSQVTDNRLLGSRDLGGGIYAGSGCTGVTLTNSSLSGNTGSSGGGGLEMVTGAANLTVTGCTISDNVAANGFTDGGGIAAETTGAVTISDSSITNNSCMGNGGGGGVAIFGASTSSITFSQDTVTGNQVVNGYGGGIDDEIPCPMTVQGCTISDNSAALSGGGISARNGSDTTITGTLLTDNVAATNPGGTTTGIGGGGLFVIDGTVEISNSTISDNVVDAPGAGGGVLLTTFFSTGSEATVSYCSFAGNVAATDGGALCAQDDYGINVSNSTFAGNVAQNGDGGAIDNAGQNARLTSDTLQSNIAEGLGGTGGALYSSSTGNVTMFYCLVLDNSATGEGGGIAQTSASLTIAASQFTANAAAVYGGAVYVATPFNLVNSTLNGNQAEDAGGGAFVDYTSSTASQIINDTFTLNTAAATGGGICESDGPLTFLNDTINANVAATSKGGGVLLLKSGSGFQNTIVAGNSAVSNVSGPDVFLVAGQTLIDNGGNLIGALGPPNGNTGFGASTKTGNPDLGPLEDNGLNAAGVKAAGGPSSLQIVQTEALLPGSLAIGAGVPSSSVLDHNDQRGFPRPGPAGISIGAYEPQYSANANNDQIFIENVYEVLLGRVADSGGMAFWVNQLRQGSTLSGVVSGIESSGESEQDVVQSLYERYLHRAADPGGLTTFENELASDTTIEQVATALMGSAEYYQLHGGNTLGFVYAIYEDGLNRVPDPAGLSFFLQKLDGGTSQAGAAALIVGSGEYQTDLVEADYEALLGRPADPSGLSTGLTDLSSGLFDQAYLSFILGSTESFDKRT
ncbi:MAG TPA: DUF4214 domain-containing protein [Gemmataceae bacterium]|nr:DUF4214 domain-containing protein [Gemmataceae bacterium]